METIPEGSSGDKTLYAHWLKVPYLIVFDSPDVPVLYGFSCEKLTFSGNRIYKSYAGMRWHPGKAMVNLEYCRDVCIEGNTWVGDFALQRMLEKACAGICGEN